MQPLDIILPTDFHFLSKNWEVKTDISRYDLDRMQFHQRSLESKDHKSVEVMHARHVAN